MQTVEHNDPEYEPEVGCELFKMELGQGELTTSQIIVEQNRDPECRQVIDYLEHGELPTGELEARKIIDQGETMSVEEPGVLCKVTRSNYKGDTPMSRFKYRMVVPATLVGRVLSLLHGDVFATIPISKNASIQELHDEVTSEAFNGEQLYDHINEYFANIGPRLAAECTPRPTIVHLAHDNVEWDFNRTPFTEDEVAKICKTIDVNKSNPQHYLTLNQ